MEPLFFTFIEGGDWIHWPDDEDFKVEYLDLRDDKAVMMGNTPVHSLAFKHFALGNYNFPRWDCINGITDMPEYFEGVKKKEEYNKAKLIWRIDDSHIC
jgi:hypothetical protein